MAAQEPALPPSAFLTGGLVRPPVAIVAGPTNIGGTIRARLRSYDGRVLITRGTNGSSLAWLADTMRVFRDSSMTSVFTVSFGSPTAITVTDVNGRCLTLIPREGTLPLNFGRCDAEPLWVYPAADSSVINGQSGFWLVSRMGMVGPTAISSLLIPRSPLRVWFRLEPITE